MTGQGYRPLSPPMRVMSEPEFRRNLGSARLRGRREAIWTGATIGFFLAGVVALVVGFSLDLWRTANHERLVAEADARWTECQALWNETQPESYGSAIETRRQIVAKREDR